MSMRGSRKALEDIIRFSSKIDKTTRSVPEFTIMQAQQALEIINHTMEKIKNGNDK